MENGSSLALNQDYPWAKYILEVTHTLYQN